MAYAVPQGARRALSVMAPPADVVDLGAYRAERRRREHMRPGQPWVADVLARVKRLEPIRDQWRGLLQECYELFLPQRNPYPTTVAGTKRGREVLDSTPCIALKRWASRKHQQLLPPQKKFAKLVPGIDTPKEQKDAFAEPLEQQTDILFAELAQSNFATEVHESILDAGISTGAFTITDGGDEMPLRFQSCPPDQLLLEEGPFGKVETIYRVHKLAKRVIEQQWPGFEFSAETLQAAAEKPDLEVEIIEACVRDAHVRRWDFACIERKAKHLGWHESLEELPWIVFGALKLSNETYRRGPAMDVLGDARTLQLAKDLVLRNAAIATAGVYTGVDDEVMDVWNVVLEPGAIIPVAQHESLKPLESARDFDISMLVIRELQQSIKEGMEVLDLGLITETPVRSATEVLKRDQEVAMDTGSSSARMQSELALPVVRLATYILARRGRMAPIAVDGREVDVEFQGPLARAQADEELLRASQFQELAAPYGEAALAAAVKPELIVRRIAERTGLWAETIRSDAEVRQLATQAAEVAQAVAAAQGVDLEGGQGAPPVAGDLGPAAQAGVLAA